MLGWGKGPQKSPTFRNGVFHGSKPIGDRSQFRIITVDAAKLDPNGRASGENVQNDGSGRPYGKVVVMEDPAVLNLRQHGCGKANPGSPVKVKRWIRAKRRDLCHNESDTTCTWGFARPTEGTAVTARAEGKRFEQRFILPTPPPSALRGR